METSTFSSCSIFFYIYLNIKMSVYIFCYILWLALSIWPEIHLWSFHRNTLDSPDRCRDKSGRVAPAIGVTHLWQSQNVYTDGGWRATGLAPNWQQLKKLAKSLNGFTALSPLITSSRGFERIHFFNFFRIVLSCYSISEVCGLFGWVVFFLHLYI